MPQTVATTSAGLKPKLLDQARDVIRRKHFSLRTARISCDWVRRLILYHQFATSRHPEAGEARRGTSQALERFREMRTRLRQNER